MSFVARKLTVEEQSHFRDFRDVDPDDAAVDDDRNAAIVALKAHWSVLPAQDFVLYLNGELYRFVFIHSPKSKLTGETISHDSPKSIFNNKSDWFYCYKYL